MTRRFWPKLGFALVVGAMLGSVAVALAKLEQKSRKEPPIVENLEGRAATDDRFTPLAREGQ